MIQQSHYWVYTEKTIIRMHVPQCSLQHYLQRLGHGNNLNDQRQLNAERRCGSYMQWNITQPLKGTKLGHFLEMWLGLESTLQSEVSQNEKNKDHILMHICGI